MSYGYYPGCSATRNARSYQTSMDAIAEKLGLEFVEVEDWNCCGATEYFTINELPAYSLVGRNLALAAQENKSEDLVASCSACFINLKKTDHYMGKSAQLKENVNAALEAGGLHYEPGSLQVKHLLEIIVKDVGFDAVAEKVEKPLYNLKIAPYYGCLVPRPASMGSFDDPEHPTSMDKLMESLGATVVDYPLKAQCCGGHMTQISEGTALELIRRLLKDAEDHGADAIVTLCPMCQLNLDAYQSNVNSRFGTDFDIPILYFTQVMGLAFGLPPKEMGFGKEIVSAQPALKKITEEAPKKKRKRRRRKKDKSLPMPTMPEEG